MVHITRLSWAWMLEKQVSWTRMLEKQDRGYRQPASSSCTGQRRRSRVEITGNRQAAHAPCHGPECSGSRRAPVESMAVVQSPWRPWTSTDSHAKEEQSSHAKEERAHTRGGPTTKRTKLKEHADGYHSGAREIRANGTITGRSSRSSV